MTFQEEIELSNWLKTLAIGQDREELDNNENGRNWSASSGTEWPA